MCERNCQFNCIRMTSALLCMSGFLFLGLCYRYTCMVVSNLRNNYRQPLDNNIYKKEYIHINLHHTCTQFKVIISGTKTYVRIPNCQRYEYNNICCSGYSMNMIIGSGYTRVVATKADNCSTVTSDHGIHPSCNYMDALVLPNCAT